MPEDRDPLAVIDRVMARLEELERLVPRLDKLLEECGQGRGIGFQVYRLAVEMEELLRLLRRLVFEECGGSAAAGPRHQAQR